DTPAARALLAAAVERNPHVPAYLTGARPIPRRLPEHMGIGDENEAIMCAVNQGAAWRAAPGALDWLKRNGASGQPRTISEPPPEREPSESKPWSLPPLYG